MSIFCRAFFKFCVSALLWSVLYLPDSHALSFTPVLMGNISGADDGSGNFLGNTYKTRPLAIGYGGIFGFNIAPKFEAQMGVLYGSRGFVLSDTAVQFSGVQIPFTFHYRPIPFLSVGLGGYLSRGLGNISTNPVGSSAVTTSPYGKGNYSADDFGVVASLGLKIGLLSFFSVIFDVRYLYGVQNISQTSGVSVYLQDFQALGGVRIGR